MPERATTPRRKRYPPCCQGADRTVTTHYYFTTSPDGVQSLFFKRRGPAVR